MQKKLKSQNSSGLRFGIKRKKKKFKQPKSNYLKYIYFIIWKKNNNRAYNTKKFGYLPLEKNPDDLKQNL